MSMSILTILVLIVLLTTVTLLITYAAFQASPHRIGYIGLPRRVIPQVVKALDLKPTEVVFDLGCGDGRILKALAQFQPKATYIGVEYNPIVLMIAKVNLRAVKVYLVKNELLDQNLKPATKIFTYLNHWTMAQLEPKLEKELRKGSRLVSCDFPLPNRRPTHVIEVGEHWRLGQNLYIYDY